MASSPNCGSKPLPELDFQVIGAETLPYAASPTIQFALQVRNALPAEEVETVLLQTQVRIETKLRPYDRRAEDHLLELFGPRDLWSQTQRSLLWAQLPFVVPRFTGETTVQLPLTCTYDFDVAAAKYFHVLDQGGIQLLFLFSGTAFYRLPDGALQAMPIPWDREASFRMPVSIWKETMDRYFPNSAWLRLQRDVFDRLYLYKVQRTLPTWEAAIQELLEHGTVTV